jgi:hypothetical protein
MDPYFEYTPGFWIWNVGFAVGKSRRQINDWYNNRKNKRSKSLTRQMTGRSGIKTIKRGWTEVLRLRWSLPPGDGYIIDCTSKYPEKEFRAFHRWALANEDIVIDYANKQFWWYRPPYADDPLRASYKIIPAIPPDPLAPTTGANYYNCFLIHCEADDIALSTGRTALEQLQAPSNQE